MMNADLVTGMFGEWGVDAPENFVVASDAHPCDHIKEHMPARLQRIFFPPGDPQRCHDLYEGWDADPAFKAGADAYAAAIKSGADHAAAWDASFGRSGRYT